MLIWGDNQYENFKEDIVPAFSVLAYEDMTIKPWEQASESSGFNASIVHEWGGGRPNVWGERGDTERLLRGHPKAAKYLATKLLQAEFDTAYAWSEGGKRGSRAAASIGIHAGNVSIST